MTANRPLLSALVGDEEIEDLLGDEAQLAAMLCFEVALAQAEADAGLISSEAASAIADGLGSFSPDWARLAMGLARDGVVVPALVAQMRDAVAAPHGGSLHMGATSQDVVDTAFMMQLAHVIPVLLDRLGGLLGQLDDLRGRYGAQTMMAHTRMQRALPHTVGAKLDTWATPLHRHLIALKKGRASVLVIQLGGPVGDRNSFSGLGDHVARGLAQRLGLGLAEPWQSARDVLIGFASQLTLLTGTLGKLGADVSLLAQNEISAVRIPGGGTSSAMSHKSNPVDAEVLVALARHNAGALGTLQQAMVHENERSGAAWTLEWMTLPSIVINTGASLRHATRLLGDLVFDAGASDISGPPGAPAPSLASHRDNN